MISATKGRVFFFRRNVGQWFSFSTTTTSPTSEEELLLASVLGPEEFQSKFVTFAQSPQADPQYFRECLECSKKKVAKEKYGLRSTSCHTHPNITPNTLTMCENILFCILCLGFSIDLRFRDSSHNCYETFDGGNQELSSTKQHGKDLHLAMIKAIPTCTDNFYTNYDTIDQGTFFTNNFHLIHF